MKLKFYFLLSLLFPLYCFSQQFQLSPQAEISVLTIEQSTNLNDAFGHSAFRIKDTSRNLDVVYDYGRYDFEAPNFILKFTLGKLNYLIGKRNYGDFVQVYQFYDRTINEQQLNLNQKQKQKLYNYLVNNYKPENRAYLYDFFYDNCATKIRDVVNVATSQNTTYTSLPEINEASFRDLIHQNVGHNTWGSFGIDIALGSLVDKTATKEEQLFLPEYVFKHFGNASIANTPLVKNTSTIYTSKNNKGYNTAFLISPIFIMSIIGFLIIYITYKDYKNNKRSNWLDIILCIITGLSGFILLFLWFGTNHTATSYNYNLLWAFPLNIFIVKQLLGKKIKNWILGYMKFLIIMLCLMCLHWIIGVQVFAYAFLPILLALLVRYIYLIKYLKLQIEVS